MDTTTFINNLIIVLLATFSGLIVYTISNKDANYIKERLKTNRVIQNKRSITDDLLEIIKPLTKANIKNNKNKDKIKKYFVKLGMSATDSDVVDFENKRLFTIINVATFMGILYYFFLKFLPPETEISVKLMMFVGIVMLPVYVSYTSPVWKLTRKIKKKEKEFEKYFPDAIDLLCVCVEAGLGIDSAIERVGREFGNFSKDIGSEFNRVAKDMLSGVPKQEALRGLSERVENKDIQSFVAIIIQADKLGASISTSLATSADSLRTKRRQRLEALVSAASTKMSIPLVLCLLPATFAVVLTPAIIQVMENLGSMYGQ